MSALPSSINHRWLRSLNGLSHYALVLGVVVVTTGLGWQLRHWDWVIDPALIPRIALVFMALRCPVGASLFGWALTILVFDWLFIPPEGQFVMPGHGSVEMFGASLVLTVLVSLLSQHLRGQKQIARDAAFRAEELYRLKTELSSVKDAPELVELTRQHLERHFPGPVSVHLCEGNRCEHSSAFLGLEAQEQVRALEACKRRDWVTQTTGDGFVLWVPLRTVLAPRGVVRLPVRKVFGRTSAQGLLLASSASELASALEQNELTLAVQQSQLEAQTERMRASLLSVVSHDLKTPLAAIIAAGTTLRMHRARLSEGGFEELLSTVVSESERLNRIIQNLLSVTRLESPAGALRRSPEALEEICAAAIRQLGTRVSPQRLTVDFPATLSLVSVDPTLVEQIFVNLLENAFRHAGPHAAVFVTACQRDGLVETYVSDNGRGIPSAEREKVFEKFYRGHLTSKQDGSMGLGLTICRAIVTAHGGSIQINGNHEARTVVSFTLPAVPVATSALPEPVPLASWSPEPAQTSQ